MALSQAQKWDLLDAVRSHPNSTVSQLVWLLFGDRAQRVARRHREVVGALQELRASGMIASDLVPMRRGFHRVERVWFAVACPSPAIVGVAGEGDGSDGQAR